MLTCGGVLFLKNPVRLALPSSSSIETIDRSRREDPPLPSLSSASSITAIEEGGPASSFLVVLSLDCGDQGRRILLLLLPSATVSNTGE